MVQEYGRRSCQEREHKYVNTHDVKLRITTNNEREWTENSEIRPHTPVLTTKIISLLIRVSDLYKKEQKKHQTINEKEAV